MIEAATLLPPLVPTVEIWGKGFERRASFDSAAPTKPTGTPIINSGKLFFLRRAPKA